jgi:unconventional prefoldin RPB5 interactor 1
MVRSNSNPDKNTTSSHAATANEQTSTIDPNDMLELELVAGEFEDDEDHYDGEWEYGESDDDEYGRSQQHSSYEAPVLSAEAMKWTASDSLERDSKGTKHVRFASDLDIKSFDKFATVKSISNGDEGEEDVQMEDAVPAAPPKVSRFRSQLLQGGTTLSGAKAIKSPPAAESSTVSDVVLERPPGSAVINHEEPATSDLVMVGARPIVHDLILERQQEQTAVSDKNLERGVEEPKVSGDILERGVEEPVVSDKILERQIPEQAISVAPAPSNTNREQKRNQTSDTPRTRNIFKSANKLPRASAVSMSPVSETFKNRDDQTNTNTETIAEPAIAPGSGLPADVIERAKKLYLDSCVTEDQFLEAHDDPSWEDPRSDTDDDDENRQLVVDSIVEHEHNLHHGDEEYDDDGLMQDAEDAEMSRRELAEEYQRLRVRFINRSGGFRKSEDEMATEPLDPKKVSRFKAARAVSRQY